VAFAEAMAAGDLTRTLKAARKDEVGHLVTTLNTMGGNLRQMFANIVKNTKGLAGSASELASVATQLACGAEETTNQSNSAAAATEEMSTNMNGVAASTEQMSANVRVVASSIEELTASISEVARSAEQAADVAKTAAGLAGEGNARVAELGAAASEIGKVIEVIQDIAEQTSLLALNATIEAARAGDAGKGFAVVATEVKELAKQTAAATEDIRHRIEGIQNSSGLAVRSIGEITDAIKKVDDVSRTIASAVEEQSITTREIAKNVGETSTAVQTMARGVAESATVARDIAKNIVEVDAAANRTAQSVTIARTTSEKVSQAADVLNSVVGQFKVSNKRFDAEPVKTAHALWSMKLSDLLAGKISLDPSEVAKHTECKFGKWYHAAENKSLAKLDVFRTVGEEHAKFHELARLIAELHKNGRQQEAAQKLGEARSLSQTLFRLLDDLEQKADSVVAAA
jgi:methyl-accepting chemotaxis protein